MPRRPKGGQILICPKCGKPAYYGKITRRRGKYGKVYTYRKFLHYAGRRGSITLRKLEGILAKHLPPARVEQILAEARKGTGAKRVEHYAPPE